LPHIFSVLWDGDGRDTFDLSKFTTNLTIDLQPGHWSSFGTLLPEPFNLTPNVIVPGNVANAYLYVDPETGKEDLRSLIENAIGGSGEDSITGNEVDNHLSGRAGADQLFGLDGNDTLDGGAGDDTMDGGVGVDRAIIHTNRAQATITRNADGSLTITSADGTDKISNVEYLQFNDQLVHVNPQDDFDGDGKSDVFFQNIRDGQGYIWQMNGLALKQGGAGEVGWKAGADWVARATGDFDGDGKGDIFLQNVRAGSSQIAS